MASITSKDITDMNLGKIQDWLTGHSTNPLGSAFGLNISEKEYNRNLWNLFMQGQSQHFNAEQAQIDRDWQTKMADTSWQRQVSDMQSAGVNPAMALGGSVSSGADIGSSSAASSSSASPGSPDDGSSLLNMFSFFTNLAMQGVDVSNKVKQGKVLDMQAENLKAETENRKYLNSRNPEQIDAAIQETKAQADLYTASADAAREQVNLYKAEVDKFVQEAKTEAERTTAEKWKAITAEYESMVMKVNSDYAESMQAALLKVQQSYESLNKAQTAEAWKRAYLAEAEAGKIEYEAQNLLPSQKSEIEAQIKYIAAQTGLKEQEAFYYGVHLYYEMYKGAMDSFRSSYVGKIALPHPDEINYLDFLRDKLEYGPNKGGAR